MPCCLFYVIPDMGKLPYRLFLIGVPRKKKVQTAIAQSGDNLFHVKYLQGKY